MGRNKLRRFAENAESQYIIEPGKDIFEKIKGNWHSEFFQNNNPIVLELACGYGEYTIGMGGAIPDKNFIGVDIKGSRLWKGMKVADEQGLENVAFLRTPILKLEDFFIENEVEDIWIVFPDPRPKDRDIKRRLTYHRYLDIYQKIQKPGSLIHLKTDNRDFFDFTLEMLAERKIEPIEVTYDLYKSPLLEEHFGIRTRYEKKFYAEGNLINYVRFKL